MSSFKADPKKHGKFFTEKDAKHSDKMPEWMKKSEILKKKF
jgi:hypothetical protein